MGRRRFGGLFDSAPSAPANSQIEATVEVEEQSEGRKSLCNWANVQLAAVFTASMGLWAWNSYRCLVQGDKNACETGVEIGRSFTLIK